MPSFSIALSGLEANDIALNTIGNNLSNLNTTAFKEQTTSFSDLFYQNLGSTGSGDPLQSGLGTQVNGTDTDYSQGSFDPTTNSNDMALNGNGFFVVDDGNIQELTRAGNFQLDLNGNLITNGGQSVMGYQAAGGVINTNGSPVALSIPVGATEAAHATQNISLTSNLDASADVGATFSSPITIYDSLGTSHQASVQFTKTAANTWNYAISLPSGDATGTPVNNTGTLTFDSNGKLTSPTGSIAGISFSGMADGANDMNFAWDLSSPSGANLISQSTGASGTSTNFQDGYASGTYQSFSVDSSGTISVTFSNNQTQQVGQLAIATVTNEQGLTRVGDNNYQTTTASGEANIGTSGTGGRGVVEDSTLEQSNVDISTEFANLIVAQRAFEANSKTVTTFDTVTQETINMIH